MSGAEATMIVHPNPNAWLQTLPGGPVAEALASALDDCVGCRAVEIRFTSAVAGYVVYDFGFSELYWHHAFVAEALRRRGLTRQAYAAMIEDARMNWTKGSPFNLEAQGKSPEGVALLKALGFEHRGGDEYGRRER